MKKLLAFVVFGVALSLSQMARADGNYFPQMVVSTTTNAGFLYQYPVPTTPGFLVGNGSIQNWTGSTITSTTTATVQAFPVLPTVTLAQLQALTPTAVGQMAMCSNCTRSVVCVSSATAINSWVIMTATGAFAGATWSGIQACQ